MNRILSAARPLQSPSTVIGRAAERIGLKETAAQSMGIASSR
jgi:hypothetical protein